MSMLQRILVALDMSTCSRAALAYAVFLAEHFGSEVVALRVLDAAADNSPSDPATAKREVDTLLASFGSRLQRGKSRVVVGDASEEILRTAADGFDLIVMGKYGWRGREHPGTGSITARVARRAPCGVVPVWEPDPSRPPATAFGFGGARPYTSDPPQVVV